MNEQEPTATPDGDDIEITEGEELFTQAAVDELLKAQRKGFETRIRTALKNQRTEVLTTAANETRRILKERT